MNNTINIFLASSAELKEDRLAIENFIGRKNKLLQQENTFIHLDIWEDFIDAVSQTRLQDEYNKKIQAADIFIMLFFTKVGMYTSEEFDKALEQFKKASKPLIYTYFKNSHIKFNDLNRKDANSVWDFQDKLKVLGHFQTVYENTEGLRLHVSDQLDKLFAEGILKKGKSKEDTQTPKCLSAGQPAITADFLGRQMELADVQHKLAATGLLLMNGEGGMGKTTLAAKYLSDHLESYQHYAWLFCENGIVEEIKTFAPKLQINLAQYTSEADQLLAIKTAMENLGKDCLLILDNANEPKHIEAFQTHFGGLHCHILLTSRCQQVLPGNEYTLSHLKPGEAKALFKTFHDENTILFEELLDKFLIAVGYNTLMIELFSKNVHELTAVGETLADTLQLLETKGLFLGARSFEVQTSWTGNVHKKAATTDEILEVLYDLARLEEEERILLVNLAVLPAESHTISLLIAALTPEDNMAFARQLKSLAKKGWLNTGDKTYRISPVVQQIVLAKNKNRIQEDAQKLVKNLMYKLEHAGGFLANLRNYAAAQPFAELAKSVIGFLQEETFENALLLLYLSDYYKNIGNYKAALIQLNKATAIFEKTDKQNFGVCLEKLGDIYQQQGEFKKALQFFEDETSLFKELYEANPHSESLKNGLAISYSKLGDIYQQQGEFKKALEFFEQDLQLTKELYEANPHSESLKNGLAISYEKLGGIYQQQGEFKKALQFFELRTQLGKELYEANPHSESLKNGLAISYERLGDIYQQQGEFKKALEFFEDETSLFKELYEANPHSESLKNGLAISYSKLGDIYRQQGEFKKALEFFELRTQLGKELYEANPHSESLKNGLAISYERLGDIYQQQGEFKKALEFFEDETSLFKELYEANPHSESLKNGLAISYSKLGDIYQQQGEFKKALEFFELRTQLGKELYEANPHSESLKNGLAISYERLGDIYRQQGEFKKALEFFELRTQLGKELYEANPHSESLKNGLAISYSKLGDIYRQQGEFKKALEFFELRTQLGKELYEANPHSESLKNGLAISYSKLGDIYRQQGEFKKALEFFELRTQLGKELYEANPHSVMLYNGLAISYTKLGRLYLEMEAPEKTKEYYRQAAQIWIDLTNAVPEAVEYKNNFVWVKQQLENL